MIPEKTEDHGYRRNHRSHVRPIEHKGRYLFIVANTTDSKFNLAESSMSGAYREALGAERWNSTGGIPPAVKWRPLVDKSYTNGAIWRIDHALVAPPGGQVKN